MDIAVIVAEHIRTDGNYRDNYNQRIIDIYENEADDDAKKAIDSIFAFLCGWELKTIISKHKNQDNG
jgi:hypothetical protein